jgi:hypothetical protein
MASLRATRRRFLAQAAGAPYCGKRHLIAPQVPVQRRLRAGCAPKAFGRPPPSLRLFETWWRLDRRRHRGANSPDLTRPIPPGTAVGDFQLFEGHGSGSPMLPTFLSRLLVRQRMPRGGFLGSLSDGSRPGRRSADPPLYSPPCPRGGIPSDSPGARPGMAGLGAITQRNLIHSTKPLRTLDDFRGSCRLPHAGQPPSPRDLRGDRLPTGVMLGTRSAVASRPSA